MLGLVVFSLLFLASVWAFIQFMKNDMRFPAIVMFAVMGYSSLLAIAFGATVLGF